jgi:hypothetical protein
MRGAIGAKFFGIGAQLIRVDHRWIVLAAIVTIKPSENERASSLLANWNCLQVQVKRSISFAFAGALHARIAAPTIVAAVLIAPP